MSGHGPVFRRAAGRVLARGCEEFWSLTFAEASARLVRGRSALEYAGFGVEGFTPPGWLASLDAMEAMAASGFRYTTTHTAVIDLVAGGGGKTPETSWRGGATTRWPCVTAPGVDWRPSGRG